MTIFDAIINNNLELVKLMIGGGVAHPHDIQPESFYRRNQKTVLQVAEFLKREEIVAYLLSSLTPVEQV